MASYAGSAIQGAGTGAAMGSVAGPWGAAIGGALGLVAGIFSAYDAEQDARRKQELLDEIKQQFNMDQQEVENLLQQYYSNPDNFLGTREDVDAYKKAVSEYDPNAFVYDFDEFNYGKSVDDFVNPYYDKIIGDTEKRISHSAAGAGVGRGTGAANAIAEGVAQKEDELYRTALNEYNTDRSQTYNEWSGNIDKMQQRLNQLRAATDTKLNNLGTLATDYSNRMQSQFSDQIAAKQGRSQGNLQLASMNLMV
jgi:cell shape-determining protein MreC